MSVELNVFPYFDDFSETKDFNRILFRPGYAVQARELTQLQTLLQNQIDKFGRHIFKNGSLVVGGQTTIDLNAKYLKIKTTNNGETVLNGGTPIILSSFVGRKIRINSVDGQNELGQAIVVKTHTDGTDNYLILSEIYGNINASTIPGSARIYFEGSTTQDAEVADINYFGGASIVSINDGIFFVDGIFCRVGSQTILVDLSNSPSKKVGLTVSHTIVSENEDLTLLDNAQGFSNYASPGAHRLKTELVLSTRELNSSEDLIDFVELIRIEDGQILKQIIYPEYSELEKTLARRTYDESGSYTVRPFKVKAFDTFRGTGTIVINAGVVTGTSTKFTEELEQNSIIIIGTQEFTVLGVGNDATANVSPTNINVPSTKFLVKNGKKLNLRVSAGKAYVKGFEFETIAPNDLIIPKARTIEDVSSHDFPIIYGGYVVSTVAGKKTEINFTSFEKVNLLDYTGATIGDARVRMITRVGNEFRLYLCEINLNTGKSFGLVRTLSKQAQPSELVSIDMASSGFIQSVASGTVTLSGTTLTGVGTRFQTELKVGSRVIINNNEFNIATISSDTVATTSAAPPSAVTIPAQMFIRDTVLRDADRSALIFPVGYSNLSNLESNNLIETFTNISYYIRRRISVTTTSPTEINFSVSSPYEFSTLLDTNNYQLFEYDGTDAELHAFSFASTPLTNNNRTLTLTGTFDNTTPKTYVLYASLKVENISPRIKTYTPYNTTIIDSDSVSNGRRRVSNYDWLSNNYVLSLNKSDVHSISKVWFNPTISGGDITGGEDITDKFEFDNGQRDTHYDFATLTLKPEFRNTSKYSDGVIMVLFNYWQHSNSIGPIVSRSYSNYNIIPLYTSTTGKKYLLRDCVDFRPIRGDGTPENDKFSSLGAEIPLPVSNFTANIAFYQSRKDRLVITSDKKFEIHHGIPGLYSVYPPINEDLMVIYNISLNPYTYTDTDLQMIYVDNKRYTMRDIGKIDNRLKKLEYYTSLSLLEKQTNDLLVKDGAGNNRFKNGFLVDNFTGHNIGDVFKPDYSCSIDFEKNELRPKFNSRSIKLHQTDDTISTLNVSEKAVVAGELVLLPYTDTKKLVSQLQCSGFVNINPYSVFSWTGQMKLEPASDFWTETRKRPDIIVNLDNNLDNLLSAENFHGTRWNDWEVNWTGTEEGRTQIQRGPTSDTVNVVTEIVAVGERTRTGLQTTGINSSLVEQSLGNRVVDVSVVPFIRQSQIKLHASSLKPNTRIYVFMDGINVTSLITSSPTYNPSSGVFMTDAVGNFEGVLDIPDPTTSSFQFTTGDKNIRITDQPLNDITDATTFAEAIYVARGILNTTEETIARIRQFEIQTQVVSETSTIRNVIDRTIRVESGWVDPVAQTFLVDPNIYPEGVFLSKTKVFFRTKDQALPVTLQIRPTVNGFPHSSYIMPLGSKTLTPNEVVIPGENEKNDNDIIIDRGTEFVFDAPVYLQPGEYCIVLLANSNNYEVYTGEIGQKRLGKTQIISEQPYAGSFFKSQNSSTWTPEQTMDLMFELNICEFTENTVYAEFVDWKPGVTRGYSDTTPVHLMHLHNTLQTFPSTTISHSLITKKPSTAYVANINNFESININRNIELQTPREVLATGEESLRYRSIMRTANKFVSPIIDLQRLNVICVENIINNVTDMIEFEHGTSTPIQLTIGNSLTVGTGTGTITEFNFKSYTFDGSNSSIVSAANDTIVLPSHNLKTGEALVYSPGAGATGPIGGLVESSTYYAVPIDSNTIKLTTTSSDAYLAAVGATGVLNITSTAGGTQHMFVAKQGSVGIKKTNLELIKSGDTFTDNNSISCTVIDNNSEENPIYGGANTRYFHRIVTLNAESDYIKVYLTTIKKIGSDIKVYYKTLPADSPLTTNDIGYKEMVQETPIVTDYSLNDLDYKEMVFSPKEDTSVEPFTKFVVKIVLLSDNKCNIPKVKDMRVIALDVI